jgi:hypothetical protein
MLYGIGDISIGTNGLTASSLLGQNLAFCQCVAGISFAAESNSVMAQCYVGGVLQKKASRINSENFSIEVTYEYASWAELQLLYGEIAQSESNVYVPTSKTVQATSTTFTVADITAANGNVGSFRIFNNNTETFMTLAAGATPANGNEYAITAAGVVTLHSSAVGQTFCYKYDKLYTSIESIGSGVEGDAVDELNNLNLTAILYSSNYPEGILLVAERLERTSSPTLAIQGDKAVITITYDLITAPGRRKPFKMYKLDSGVI